MMKKILLILTVLCYSSIHAQYDAWTPAKVILKNGTSFRGLVKFPKHSGGLISIGSTEFKYKKKKKSSTEKYGSKTVDEVIFGDEDFTTVHFKYVPIKKNRLVLMELVIRGKVNLYTRTVSKSYHVINSDPNFPFSAAYYDDYQFYLLRENEQVAELIAGPINGGNFISKAKKYFSDCELLVQYLENDLYSSDELIELIDDYNLLCE